MWVSMPELIDLLGQDAATTLAKVKGGLSLYVPKTINPAHELAKIVGLKGGVALCAVFAGQYITIPNGKREPHKERIFHLLELGKPKRDIAAECGVTERYVYFLASQVQETKQKQCSLL